MNKINETGKVTFGQAWKDFWKGYFDFKGITTRAGFWWGALIYGICLFIDDFIKGFIYGFVSSIGMEANTTLILEIYYVLYTLITIPILAAAARHFRDEGLNNTVIAILVICYVILQILIKLKCGTVFVLIALIFNIAMIVLLCMPTGNFIGKKD